MLVFEGLVKARSIKVAVVCSCMAGDGSLRFIGGWTSPLVFEGGYEGVWYWLVVFAVFDHMGLVI